MTPIADETVKAITRGGRSTDQPKPKRYGPVQRRIINRWLAGGPVWVRGPAEHRALDRLIAGGWEPVRERTLTDAIARLLREELSSEHADAR